MKEPICIGLKGFSAPGLLVKTSSNVIRLRDIRFRRFWGNSLLTTPVNLVESVLTQPPPTSWVPDFSPLI